MQLLEAKTQLSKLVQTALDGEDVVIADRSVELPGKIPQVRAMVVLVGKPVLAGKGRRLVFETEQPGQAVIGGKFARTASRYRSHCQILL